MPDIEEIENKLRAACKDYDTTIGGALSTLIGAIAEEIALARIELVQYIAMLDPATCLPRTLLELGKQNGLYPFKQRGAILEYVFEKKPPQIPTGAIIHLGETDKIPATITGNSDNKVTIQTLETGKDINDKLINLYKRYDYTIYHNSTPYSATNANIKQWGANTETVNEFRNRYLQSMRIAPFGGNELFFESIISNYDITVLFSIQRPTAHQTASLTTTFYCMRRDASGIKAPYPLTVTDKFTLTQQLEEVTPVGMTIKIDTPAINGLNVIMCTVKKNWDVHEEDVIKTAQEYCTLHLGEEINLDDMAANMLKKLLILGYTKININPTEETRAIKPHDGHWIFPTMDNTNVEYT